MKTRSRVKPEVVLKKSRSVEFKNKTSVQNLKAEDGSKGIPKGKDARRKKVSASQNCNNSETKPPILSKKTSKKASKLSKSSLEEVKVCQIEKDQYGKPKTFTKHDTKIAKLTEWIDITILELRHIIEQERKHHKDVEEEEICPIGRGELYDDLLKLSKSKLEQIQADQLANPSSIDVVKFKNGMDHFYHKSGTEGMLAGKEYIKGAVCSQIYGELIGDSPPGRMKWWFCPKGQVPLETYEDEGSWMIDYSFYDGVRDGVNYRGTRRHAYVPDTKEGREVLFLLIKAFKRKVTFTVGDSVTTGRKNVVVWNSIHHKTHTHGGTLCYGYPDPTYFNRVKLEMADKGVVLEEGENPNKIAKSGSVTI